MFRTAIPVLHVSNAALAESFYCDRLRFERRFAYQVDPARPDPCYMGIVREGARLHLSSFPGDGIAGNPVFIVVEDVDALFNEFRAAGVEVELEPTDQTWGNREMYVNDPDGNSLRFVGEREWTGPMTGG